ncbi:MAG TPA: class II aldolase/adducin family protein [Candidatus Udaeobacter sp.]|nr:class II aldolase/adducin family protein [Candidatus Udaeobacter sp.]
MSEYVKFTHARASADIPAFTGLAALNTYRRKLLELQLIGVDSNGVSFGNLSIRDGATENFYVTGSATGALPDLTLDDCARVVAYNFEKNRVRYDGVAIPSSESLTHAAIYESDANAGAVIHCHDSKVWLALLNQAPTTSKSAKYGTPEMAFEILRLFANRDLHRRKVLVMSGHDAGIVTFGKDLEEAFAVLIGERRGIAYPR